MAESEGNVSELQKVIEHYSRIPEDSQKLKAAKFLIANMPGHFTPIDESYAQKNRAIYRNKHNSYFSRKSIELSLSYNGDCEDKIYDIKTISADFLISHIDATFRNTENCPWLYNIDEDIFFEYLLPYRFLYENPDAWRDSLTISDKALANISTMDDKKYLCSQVAQYLYLNQECGTLDEETLQQLFGMPSIENCYFSAANNLLKYRAMGIPSAIDFTPQYANRNGFHYWISTITQEEKYPSKGYSPERKAPKIYRYTYSKANDYVDNTGEFLPDLFRNPFIKDVTSLYQNTASITLESLKNKYNRSAKYNFLCVFNELEWHPVAIGARKGRKTMFSDLGTNIVYMPVCYEGDEMKGINYPFILYNNSTIESLSADTLHKQTLTIRRKYPYSSKLKSHANVLNGMKITGSNSKGFNNERLLTTLEDCEYGCFDGKLNSNVEFRYIKLNPTRNYYDVAEIIIYDSIGNVISGSVDSFFENAFDEDPLSYVNNSDAQKNELIIDFAKPVSISRIVCLPRSDGNGIYPANTYELLYYELDGWRSLGIKVARDFYVEYNNVPKGALYWLRNVDWGSEDRPFTYKNGRMVFW